MYLPQRSAKEAANRRARTVYIALNRAAVDSGGLVDMIDLELLPATMRVKATVSYAHQHNVAVIMSNHDFHTKRPQRELFSVCVKASRELGAVFRRSPSCRAKADVLTLLTAAPKCRALCGSSGIITMSCRKPGVISRLAGEVFGSAATFGAVKKHLRRDKYR
ncbi:type I 3-dehydroquinate dehydratase [Salmonella enterica subsp. enterica]|nr:type I 3-dehydroquinate dehydratase [Salmonella enterica subsp. enterica]